MPTPDRRAPRRRWSARWLVILVSLEYLVLSLLTLPFLNSWWLGEIPVVALVQLPKVELAKAIQDNVVKPALPRLGLSLGSASPDHLRSRLPALALAQGLLHLPALLLSASAARDDRRARLALGLLLVLAWLDYGATLAFASGPGLTIY